MLEPVLLLALVALGAVPDAAQAPSGRASGSPAVEAVTLPRPESPLVAVRVLLRVGSIHDPKGKEGLAALTGLMVGQGGTRRRPYTELLEALYPMAASIGVHTDREVTVFSGQTHKETLDRYTSLLTEVLLEPAFDPSDFERNREQLLAFLTSTLRSANDELLGLEAVQQRIFAGRPYEHTPAGTVEGLRRITIDDVQRFYAEHYTQAGIILGVAGGYPDRYVSGLQAALAKLPAGKPRMSPLPPPPSVKGRVFTLVEKQTDSVGIHFGYALPINRHHADFYPLLVANSYLGEHRTFHGRLMQQLRGLRGLNYGDYSYIEYWENPPGTTSPSPAVPRRQQYFSVWVRPVVPDTALFALRNAIFEVNRLAERGLTREEFELTRQFVVNYSKLWAQTLSDRLGFHLDSRFYGMPYYIDEIEKRLARLTVEDVNRVIKKYLQADNVQAVMVLSGADAMKTALEAGKPSPMRYTSEVPDDVKTTDRSIEALPLKPASIRIVPVQQMFAK